MLVWGLYGKWLVFSCFNVTTVPWFRYLCCWSDLFYLFRSYSKLTPYTTHYTLWSHYTLHPTPYTLHTLHTLHTRPYTRTRASQAPNQTPRPSTHYRPHQSTQRRDRSGRLWWRRVWRIRRCRSSILRCCWMCWLRMGRLRRYVLSVWFF